MNSRPFDCLRLVCDPVPGAAAYNMALDEVLLSQASGPILRVYQWARPAVSFGYFEAWAAVRSSHPEREPVRRWTGGGVVLHGEDWTYSILIPRGEGAAALRAEESYRLFHERVAMALNGEGGAAFSFAPETADKISRACFENAARNDLLFDDRKIAGAAQRRSRHGVLHQGSLLGIAIPSRFSETLARYLAREVELHPPTSQEQEAALALASTRYATSGWLEKF